MTSLQSILTHNLKKAQSSAPASVLPETQAVHTQQSTKDRVSWLQSLFPAEPQEILRNFANTFSSEKDMQDKALQLKREGKDIHGEVADWSFVNSKHQSLRNRKQVEEPLLLTMGLGIRRAMDNEGEGIGGLGEAGEGGLEEDSGLILGEKRWRKDCILAILAYKLSLVSQSRHWRQNPKHTRNYYLQRSYLCRKHIFLTHLCRKHLFLTHPRL
jgi:hypothetical protein